LRQTGISVNLEFENTKAIEKLRTHILLVILIILYVGCALKKEPPKSNEYLRWVDDILFDSSIDDKTFTLCHGEDSVIQYFNNGKGLEYEGEKYAIIREFEKRYDPTIVAEESGLVRIRFIVNCQGETDRFRVLSMDFNYVEKEFDEATTNQLLEITRSLNGWQPKQFGNQTADYYQYLIFKIDKGRIVKILP
jgi:hypothetical protein